MATVNRVDGPRGPRWVVRYRRPDGGATMKRFTEAKAARTFASKVETEKAEGTFVDRSRSKLTFAEMAELWRAIAPHSGHHRGRGGIGFAAPRASGHREDAPSQVGGRAIGLGGPSPPSRR